MNKTFLITLAVMLTIALLIMLVVCAIIIIEYWDITMGNEAYGFFSIALLLTLIICIPTIIVWVKLLKLRNSNP